MFYESVRLHWAELLQVLFRRQFLRGFCVLSGMSSICFPMLRHLLPSTAEFTENSRLIELALLLLFCVRGIQLCVASVKFPERRCAAVFVSELSVVAKIFFPLVV